MKKILLFALLVCLFCASFEKVEAQTYNSSLVSKDTLTDADTLSTIVTITGNKGAITFSVEVTKISGTVAGDVTVYGQIAGSSNYYVAYTDTLTNTTGTKLYNYSFSYNPYVKYKVVVHTSGTCSASVLPNLMYR